MPVKIDDVPAEKPMPEHLANLTFTADDDLTASPIEKETPKDEQETVATTDKTDTGSKRDDKLEDSKSDPNAEEAKVEPEGKADEGEKKEEKKDIKSFLKPPAEKKEEGETEKKEKKEVVKQISPNKITRDYTGFSQEEVSHLKQMSDSAYKYVTEIIKKQRESAKASQEMFFQHPDAYTLTPEYAQAQRDAYNARREGAIWADILRKCKNGEKFKAPVDIDPKTGEFTYSDEITPNGDIEEAVRANLLKCQQAVGEQSGRLKTLAESHKQKIQTDLQIIQQERKNRFAWVADPSLMDYSVEIEGMGQVPLKTVKENFVNLFPPYLRNNPATEVAADLMIAMRIQYAQLQEALANQKVAEIKKEEAVRAEPTSKGKAIPKTKVNGVSEFTLEGAENLTGIGHR